MTHNELEQFNALQKRVKELEDDYKLRAELSNPSVLHDDLVKQLDDLRNEMYEKIDSFDVAQSELARRTDDLDICDDKLFEQIRTAHNALCDVVSTWCIQELHGHEAEMVAQAVAKARLPQGDTQKVWSDEGGVVKDAVKMWVDDIKAQEAQQTVKSIEHAELLYCELSQRAERAEAELATTRGDYANLKAINNELKRDYQTVNNECKELLDARENFFANLADVMDLPEAEDDTFNTILVAVKSKINAMQPCVDVLREYEYGGKWHHRRDKALAQLDAIGGK